MKAKGIVIFLALMILVSFILANLSEAEEQDQEGVLCFFKANEYLEFPEEFRQSYVAGLMDSAYVCLWAFEYEKYQKYRELTRDMTVEQLWKIFDKYLEEHPEELHYSAGACFLNALDEIVYK